MDNETDCNIFLTRITTKRPKRLSKGFRLDKDGNLEKIPPGAMSDGLAETIQLSGINELADLLNGLNPSQALVYGISEHDKARVLSKKALNSYQANGGPPVITRTRNNFSWPDAGIFMKDGDFGDGTMDPGEYLEKLYEQCPGLKDAQHLLAHSASSHIHNGGECLKGAGGLRVLTAVKNSKDIPRAGKVLFKRLFIAGHGFIFITKSGAMLPRTLVDSAVYQPERMDYCGGAHCLAPLEQRRPDPVCHNPDGPFLDTETALPDLTAHEEKAYQDAVIQAKHDAWPEAKATQETWIDEQVEAKLKDVDPGDQEAERERLREVYTLAARHKKLLGDYEITLEGGEIVTVLDLLSNKDKYHGKRTLDPLEPDYDGGRFVGWLNLRAAGRPYLHSHAHGGQKFFLHTARQTLRIIEGERFDAVTKALEVLTINGAHYDRGGELVTVSDTGEIFPRQQAEIQFDVDGLLRFEQYVQRYDEWRPKDCKATLACGIMAARPLWKFPKLKGVADTPILDPATDRLIAVDGYDPETQLILTLGDMRAWPGIPPEPTDVQLEDAVMRLWKPFKKFPFDSAVSTGVYFSALLSTAVRQLLKTSPGIAVDSPVAGSGKTLLCKCGAALAGEEAGLLPDARDNEEIRKRLLPLLRQGKRVLILDNITGVLESSALCVLLTSEVYQDRILGASETVSIPTRTQLFISGNNISLKGDLCRRILKCRIDPNSATPWKRKFDFDPVDYCKRNRLQMIADALTIVRAGIQRGPKMTDRTASFELWSDSVRRSVLLVRNLDLIGVDDPVESITESYELDPETAKLDALMNAWLYVFEDKVVSVANLIRQAEIESNFNPEKPELQDALLEIAGEGKNINSRRLGRWIERNRDRIVGDLKIISGGPSSRAKVWKIANCAKT